MKYVTERPEDGRGSGLTPGVSYILKTNPKINEKNFGQYELLPGVKSIGIRIWPELTHLGLSLLTVSCCACIKFHVIPELHITFLLSTFMSYYHKGGTVIQDQTKHLSSWVSCFWQQPGVANKKMSSTLWSLLGVLSYLLLNHGFGTSWDRDNANIFHPSSQFH